MFVKAEPTEQAPYRVYHLIRPGKVDAAKLCAELESALGVSLSGPSQEGHVVTAEIAYVGQTTVQIRLKREKQLSAADEQKAEQVILDHLAE